jgi:hypothetical protein
MAKHLLSMAVILLAVNESGAIEMAAAGTIINVNESTGSVNVVAHDPDTGAHIRVVDVLSLSEATVEGNYWAWPGEYYARLDSGDMQVFVKAPPAPEEPAAAPVPDAGAGVGDPNLNAPVAGAPPAGGDQPPAGDAGAPTGDPNAANGTPA